MPRTNPFAVIEAEIPQLPESEILQMLREHYGLEVELEALLSERDQNFRLRCGDGRQVVLKITNAVEAPLATDFQVQALLHLESYLADHDCPITVPRVLPTVDGSPDLPVASAGRQHIARVVGYVAGIPLGDTRASPTLCRRLGEYLAHLGTALHAFNHPGSAHGLLWDMQQALALRQILEHVSDLDLRQGIEGTLDDSKYTHCRSFRMSVRRLFTAILIRKTFSLIRTIARAWPVS